MFDSVKVTSDQLGILGLCVIRFVLITEPISFIVCSVTV